MKRTLTATAAAVAVLLAVVAAPALAYQPAPVGFSKAARGGSGSLVTAKRFNVVGLGWSGRAQPHVHLRVRQAHGGWSRWRELPVGRGFTDAAWAGDANAVQYRISRRVPGLRIRFVNSLGTATARARARTAARRAFAGPFAARAEPPAGAQPSIVPRSGWDPNRQCPPRSAPQYGQVKLAFVHHTVTLNDYSPEESPSIVLGICRYHRNSNRWNDIGYNFLVDKYGTIFEGRAGGIDRPVVGAQAEGFNSQSTGIANLGDYSSTPQSSAALQSMARLIRWKLPLEGAPTSGTVRVTSAGGSTNRFPEGTTTTLNRISGHRDGNNTECPGDALYNQLPELRQMVGSEQPAPAPTLTLSATASPTAITAPAATTIRGQLVGSNGTPQQVTIEARSGSAWRPAAYATTDASGAYSTTLAPTANMVVRATAAGVSSQRIKLSVRPGMTLKLVRKRLRGGIEPRKPFVNVVFERRVGKRYRTVARTRVAVSAAGRWGLTPRSLRRGRRYRVTAVFAGDSLNVASRSKRVYFRAR